MAKVAARDRYFEMLLDKARAEQHPSLALLDRLYQSMRHRGHAEQLIDVLLEKTQGQYPSPWNLERLDRVIGLLEVAEELRDRQQRPEKAAAQ